MRDCTPKIEYARILANTAMPLFETIYLTPCLSVSPSEETSKESSLDNSMHQEHACTDRVDQGSDSSSAAASTTTNTGSTENVPRYGKSELTCVVDCCFA